MNGGNLRVLVVDDSAYNRRVIADILEGINGVEVVGKACDGDEALQLALRLEPDLITLDLEMPRMDGFKFLRLLMARRPTPVIVVSGYSEKENVFRALELGAIDFVAKPTRTITADLPLIRNELAEKVALIRHLRPASQQKRTSLIPRTIRKPPTAETRRADRIIVIGASTGGPTALVRLFRRLPPNLPASIVVAQHMPPRFTRTFAGRLDGIAQIRVAEAQQAHPLRTNEAWVCPGGQSVEIGADATVVVRQSDPSDRYVPSVDRLFSTAARKFGRRCLAIVLTGMGDDGAVGAKEVRTRGGIVLAESKESAAIYGMPGAAERAGVVSALLTVPELAGRVRAFASGNL